jgi:hypothetical protein
VGLNPDAAPGRRRRRDQAADSHHRVNPLSWAVHWADWFEERGVYIPGEDSRSLSTWRDFGWLIALWLIAVSAFVVFFAIVS